MPDRFANCDTSNDKQPGLTTDRTDPRAWHCGDLAAAQVHLEYLQRLGVTVLWLTPIVKNDEPGSYYGFVATDLYRVDPHLGTLADAQSLASALHALGMRWVPDIIPNHVGPGHCWVGDEPTPLSTLPALRKVRLAADNQLGAVLSGIPLRDASVRHKSAS